MAVRHLLLTSVALSLVVASVGAAATELADAAMNQDVQRLRSLLEQGANVDAPQIDGSTALHWAAHFDAIDAAQLLLEAGANVAATNRAGATPLRLAAINGSAAMIGALLEAGADPNAALTPYGDTALMLTSRTGEPAAMRVLLDSGADVNAVETWGGTTALMWAIAEHHLPAVALLLEQGAAVDVVSKIVPVSSKRLGEANVPVDAEPGSSPQGYANGGFTPLLFAAREGELEAARLLLAGGADVNAIAADGKNVLGLAIYNGHYELASLLIDAGADVNHADAEGFPPLFWAVDRRNMEWSPGLPWTVTADPLPLIRKLLDSGADPNTLVDNTPRSRRNFGGSPRIRFATSLMRAAYSGDLELVRVLLEYGADPFIRNSDNESTLMAAAGYAFIDGYSQGRSTAERLATIELLIELGADVNWACNHGITALMMAANLGETEIIEYLVDQGADLSAHDLGKKNDGVFGGSIEPLMAIDYAIGVGSFRPNNAVLHMAEATELLTRLMAEQGIVHPTSECTLRAFSCGDVDPQGSSPADIAKTRAIQIGNQVEGVTGGLAVELDVPTSDSQ